eukprot:gene2820-3505_t
MTSCNIRVMARPLNDREKALKENQNVFDFPNETQVVISHTGKNEPFTFDRIFPPDSTQEEVFETIESTVTDVLSGFNATIFTYGQTGSGKTFSLFGDKSSTELAGIIPRCNVLIFNSIAEDTSGSEFSIKCSFLEIYMENIQDLLNPKNNKNLKIRESKSNGIFIEGLAEEYVSCEEDIMELISQGETLRSVAKTNMNQRSSRSHSILILSIEQKSSDGSLKRGKLNLVDLAGSERVVKTGAEGMVLEEAKKINQSLSLLGNCIHALTEGKSHIPFRDSKLTRLLQDSLGGNTKTTLMVTCSPHFSNIEETISTLRFGARAKTIKNLVKVNQQKSAAELQIIVNALTKELSSLKIYSISLENLITYMKSPNYVPGVIPKELEPQSLQEVTASSQPSTPSSNNTLPSGISTPPPSKSKMARHSVSLTPSTPSSPYTPPSYRNSVAISSSSASSANGGGLFGNNTGHSSSSSSSPSLFDPLAIVELTLQMDKLKEDNQVLIDKFKDEISEITIKFESSQEELTQAKLQLELAKESAEQIRITSQKEQSQFKENERNLSFENNNQQMKIQSLTQRIEDYKLLGSQVIQYLERKKSSDYLEGEAYGLSADSLAGLEDTDGEIKIEEVIRYLTEEEIFSLQIKIQLQNKCAQLEQKISQLQSECSSLETFLSESKSKYQELEKDNSELQRKLQSMIDNERIRSNFSPQTPGSPLLASRVISKDKDSSSSNLDQLLQNGDTNNTGGDENNNQDINQNEEIQRLLIQLEQSESEKRTLQEYTLKLKNESIKNNENESKLYLEIKNLKNNIEKQQEESSKLKEDLNIKSKLSQNQINNLQNEIQSLQNKLQQEKQSKQNTINQQLELTNKYNELIKDFEIKEESFHQDKSQFTVEKDELQLQIQDLESKVRTLQEELTSVQRQLVNRRVVKILRSDEKGMKKALESKLDFGQHTLRKTGRNLI